MTRKVNFAIPFYWLYTTSKGISQPTFSKPDSIQTRVCAVGTWLQVLQVIKQSTVLRSGIMWRMRSHCIFRSAWCSCEAYSYPLFLFFSIPLLFFCLFLWIIWPLLTEGCFCPRDSHTYFCWQSSCAASKLKCLLLRIWSLLFLFCPNAWRIFWLLTEFLLLRLWKVTELKNVGLPCKTGKIIIREKKIIVF